jgi:hypothetical protein
MNTAEKKGSDNQKSIGNRSICNNHSSVHIHTFISPEILEAWLFRINTGNIAAVLYQDAFWSQLLLFNPWRSLQVHFKMCSLWRKHHYSWDNWWNTVSCTLCNFTSLGNDRSPRPSNKPPRGLQFITCSCSFFGNGYLCKRLIFISSNCDQHRRQRSWWYVLL